MRARVVLASTVFDTYFDGPVATLELDRQLAVRRPPDMTADGPYF